MNKLYLLLVAALLFACAPADTQEAAATSQTNAVRQVRTLTAEAGDLTSTRSAAVTVDPLQESQVAADASGKVASILKREGSVVEAGEAVLRLDAQKLQLELDNARVAVQSAQVNLDKAERASAEGAGQADSGLASAQVTLSLAQQQYTQGQALFAAGGISQTELTNLEAQLKQAQASYEQAQNALAQSQRSGSEDIELLRLQLRQARTNLARAERNLADATITAPFSGEVAEILVEAGEFVQMGAPAFKLVSTEQQIARFSLPPQDARRLTQQGQVYVRYAGLDYAAQIVRSSDVAGNSGLVDITAEIYASETRIPTGASAQLRYNVDLGSGISLPAGALKSAAGQNYVYVIDEGAARQQTVQVVSELGDRAVVNGLESGTQIIYPVPADLRAGAQVQAVSVAQR